MHDVIRENGHGQYPSEKLTSMLAWILLQKWSTRCNDPLEAGVLNG